MWPIERHRAVGCQQLHGLGKGLGDEKPVKRITMQFWYISEGFNVASEDRQFFKTTSTRSVPHLGNIGIELPD